MKTLGNILVAISITAILVAILVAFGAVMTMNIAGAP